MLPFSKVRYYASPELPIGHFIPHRLTIELGIFSGRLYFEFDECAPLVQYIEKVKVSKHPDASSMKTISFLLEWLCLRRKGQDIMHTPVGYVLQGRPLDSGHAFFVTNRFDDKKVIEAYHVDGAADQVEDVEGDEEDDWDGVHDTELV